MKIIWFVSSLEQKGGGERFALEAASALRDQGHTVTIVCDRIGPAASFDGTYDLNGIVCTSQSFDHSQTYAKRALKKFRGIFSLYGIIKSLKPELVICQSEFDAVRLFFLSSILSFRYRVFVFGQMYQFKTDISRYSSVFKKHLPAVINSRPGYKETVLMPPPKLPALTWLVNELVSRFKYLALRRADRVFTLSNQVRWEVSLVYGCEATVCRAAFNESYIDVTRVSAPCPLQNPIRFLSVSRLVDKKRIHLIIDSFCASSVEGRLTIVGSGPEGERLKAQALLSPRSADIEFLGAVDDAHLRNTICAADCFVSMDVGDFDISVVEAMGKGVRVIVATDFDLSEFGADFAGAIAVEPTVTALTKAMNNVGSMSPPNEANLGALSRLTWQSLAKTCVSGPA